MLYTAVQYEKQKYIIGLLLSHPEKCLSCFRRGPIVDRGKMERVFKEKRNKFQLVQDFTVVCDLSIFKVM